VILICFQKADLQQEIQFSYVYQLQWAFLATKEKKTFKEQEQTAMVWRLGIYLHTNSLLVELYKLN